LSLTQKQRARELRSQPTPAERKLWTALRASQLEGFKFSRQIAIGPFIVDLVCRKHLLVIEIDGGQHGDAADVARQRYIEAQRYRVLRLWNHKVMNDLDMVFGINREALIMGQDPPPTAGAARRLRLPVPGGEQQG
jgi:very-short-patch-repair endonuclease